MGGDKAAYPGIVQTLGKAFEAASPATLLFTEGAVFGFAIKSNDQIQTLTPNP